MTFMEVLIAVVIAGMILPVMLVCLNFASRYARHNANKLMALNYAQGLMEEIKSTPYSDLDNYDEYSDVVSLYQGDGVNVQANRAADVDSDDVYKKIIVSVSWDWQGKSYNEEINTLRYNY